MTTCSIQGCGQNVACRGWCSKHYTRWQRHGDPLAVTRTPPATADAVEKHCPRCAVVKPIDQFGTRPSGKPKGYCRECEANYQREYFDTPTGREAHRKARSRWNDGNHGYFLSYRYGLTLDDYRAMLAAQGGVCAICGTDNPGGKAKVWNVDHCHRRNEVRGLLCGPCNRGLGQFHDDPERLRRAAVYLEQST